MEAVTPEYINAMNKVCRDPSQFEIEMDIVNIDIEASANVSYWTPSITPYSEPNKIVRKTTQSRQFATFEEKYLKADGSMYIYDFDSSLTNKLKDNGGFEVDILSDEYGNIPTGEEDERFINIALGTTYDVDNLTLYFDIFNTKDFPIEYIVTGYVNGVSQKSVTVTNDSPISITENLGFTGIDRIMIAISKMSRANIRPRLYKIRFGIIKIYTNNELLKVGVHNEIDLTSSKLPDYNITFSVDNENHDFNPENPNSITKYLMANQEITARIGIETVNGKEWIPIGNYYLSEWDTSRDEANFKGVSLLDIFNNIDISLYDFYINRIRVGTQGGTFLTNGYSLIELLKYIVKNETNCILQVDSSVTDLITHKPVPIDLTRKQIIQLIAQALGACIQLFFNEDGKTIIKLTSLKNTSAIFAFNFSNSEIPQSILTPKLKDMKVKKYNYNTDSIKSIIYETNMEQNGSYQGKAIVPYHISLMSANDNWTGLVTDFTDLISNTVANPRYLYSTNEMLLNYSVVLASGKTARLAYIANKINVAEEWMATNVNSDGDILEIDNIFCTTQNIAQRITDNYRYWYSQRFNYNVKNRGFPELNCGDSSTVQTEFSGSVSGNIVENSYEWQNGAIKNANTTIKVGGT